MTLSLPYASAQIVPGLPQPGVMVGLSQVFEAPNLKGMVIYPDNPLRFDFIVHNGGYSEISKKELEKESQRLIKYFLATLTIPEDDLWVNLSPYEKDRITTPELGITEMGKDLLSQDYLLNVSST